MEGEQSQPPARERTAEYTFKDPEPARRPVLLRHEVVTPRAVRASMDEQRTGNVLDVVNLQTAPAGAATMCMCMSLKNDWPQITLCPPPERLIQRKLHGRLDICWIARRESCSTTSAMYASATPPPKQSK